MANGKTFKIGKRLINVSAKGIATKDTESGEINRYAFPWTKAPKPAQPADESEETYVEDSRPYQSEENYDETDYDQDGYDGEEEYPGGEGEDDTRDGGVMNSTWFMWLMLIVLPPLGIWLLWRNNRYEITPRSAISAAAIVWFIMMLIWLFSHLGGQDNTVVNLPSASPSAGISLVNSATPEPETSPEPTDSGSSTVNLFNLGTPTPTPSGSVSAQPTPNTVGTSGIATATPEPQSSSEPGDIANAGGTTPAQNTYVWSTPTGKNYHSYSTCNNMQNAERVTLSVALNRNQTACPLCWATPSASVRPTATPLPSGMYYATPTGSYYHSDPTCQGMRNAQAISEADAIARGQTACPECIGSVYITDNGTWYHANSTCQGMKNARKVTVADAKQQGKTECPVCMNGTTTGTVPGATTPATGNEVYYATSNGTWYHANSTCQGMTNAYRSSAAAAEQAGKAPCPVCLDGSSGVASYYATSGGTYYHTDRTCSGMTGASRVTLATALARGQTACPKCAGGTPVVENTPSIVTVDPGTGTGSSPVMTGDSTLLFDRGWKLLS